MIKNNLTLLREATHTLHKRVEAVDINKVAVDQTMTLDNYKKLIQCNYLIHDALEREIKTALNSISTSSISNFFHSKLDWLEKDLNCLGLKKPILAASVITPPRFHSNAALIGCIYVIEGSMLGGSIIYKALRSNKNLTAVPEFHFFKNYGSKIGLRWKTFKNIANDEHLDTSECVQAAQDTFRFYETVFNLQLD